MQNAGPRDDRSFVEQWKKTGAMLAERRRTELRHFDYEKNRAAVLALLELAVKHAQPRTTSGLVKQQKLFMEAARKAGM